MAITAQVSLYHHYQHHLSCMTPTTIPGTPESSTVSSSWRIVHLWRHNEAHRSTVFLCISSIFLLIPQLAGEKHKLLLDRSRLPFHIWDVILPIDISDVPIKNGDFPSMNIRDHHVFQTRQFHALLKSLLNLPCTVPGAPRLSICCGDRGRSWQIPTAQPGTIWADGSNLYHIIYIYIFNDIHIWCTHTTCWSFFRAWIAWVKK